MHELKLMVFSVHLSVHFSRKLISYGTKDGKIGVIKQDYTIKKSLKQVDDFQ